MLTEYDKKLIAEYMCKHPISNVGEYYFETEDNVYHPAIFDLNDAGLCVGEMGKRGEWLNFTAFGKWLYLANHPMPNTETNEDKVMTVEIWSLRYFTELFNADNFFSVMVAWLKNR